VTRRQQHGAVSELLDAPGPVVGGAMSLHHDGGEWFKGEDPKYRRYISEVLSPRAGEVGNSAC
jgi:hypothetical protein